MTTTQTPARFIANIIENNTDDHTSAVDIRTLPAARLEALRSEAGAAGDTDLYAVCSELLGL